MGFFSQDCEGCGHPMLSFYVTTAKNVWMNNVVAIQHDGRIVTGSYDGYGRLENEECDDEDCTADDCLSSPVGSRWDEKGNPTGKGATVWHAACWKAMGSPPEWRGESKDSRDQGYFFDDRDHAVAEPKSPAGVERGRRKAEKVAAAAAAEDAKWAAKYAAEQGSGA